MARTVKSVMSCELKRASPYSVDLRWWRMVLQNNHILRHVEITSMMEILLLSVTRILQNPVQ